MTSEKRTKLLKRRCLETSLMVALIVSGQAAHSAASAANPAGQTVATSARSAAFVTQLPRRAEARWTITVAGWAKTFKRGDQRRIDRCAATLWWGPFPEKGAEPTWLAGHRRCGFWRWDRHLPVGSRFVVTGPGHTTLTYRVTGRNQVSRQSGSSEGLIRGDMTLQTCRGTKTILIYADVVARG